MPFSITAVGSKLPPLSPFFLSLLCFLPYVKQPKKFSSKTTYNYIMPSKRTYWKTYLALRLREAQENHHLHLACEEQSTFYQTAQAMFPPINSELILDGSTASTPMPSPGQAGVRGQEGYSSRTWRCRPRRAAGPRLASWSRWSRRCWPWPWRQAAAG